MKKILLICAIILSCSKTSTCPIPEDVQGTWLLQRVVKLSQTLISYDSTDYYSYEFTNDIVYVSHFENGLEVSKNTIKYRCNSLWFICDDSLYYGDLANYGVLVKDF